MHKLLVRACAVFARNVFELIAMVGLALLLVGCWLVWTPLPYLVAGSLLLGLGIWGAIPWGSCRR